MPVNTNSGLLIFSLLLSGTLFAQSVGIGTNSPHASAQLDIVSNNKGLAIPSMTKAQRIAIASPKAGLIVFDQTLQALCMYNGSNWVYFQSSPEPNETLPVGIIADDGEVGDRFGWSVDISGNYAIIGAPNDNVGSNTNQGCAYIFFYNDTGWVQQAKLTASNGLSNDQFGYSVAISGDYAIVGMPYDDVGAATDRGSAYIFVRSGSNWSQQAILLGTGGVSGDNFGFSVSISGTNSVIGSPGDDVGMNADQGTAYFFNRSGVVWTQQDYVTLPSGAANDQFGYSVDISGNWSVIGAPYDDELASNIGSVHFFEFIAGNWSHELTVDYGGNIADKYFGTSVSIDGTYAVMGIPSLSSVGGGWSYKYNGSNWNPFSHVFQDLTELTVGEDFGKSVAVSGTTFLVSRPQDQEGVIGDGIVYVLQTDGTENFFVRRINNPFPAAFSYMGWSVAISATRCALGTPYANGEKGIVYFLSL